MAPYHENEPHAANNQRGYIGLSFSGGGYRATSFSLGTMALLQDLELLGHARVISGVSGGSLAVGAYLCAKAGANLSKEHDFQFYQQLWKPLMKELATEELADAFVQLPLLLDGQKLIVAAADKTQQFLSQLLKQEAQLGNEAITQMLRNQALSPDYVFFNAANISSLDLFRFGIQRGGDAKQTEPVYVLNRYFLSSSGDSLEANDLYKDAKQLRLGDCVAASFAFPGGFEPMIFPDDYYRPHGSANERESATARAHFRNSLICDRRPYVGLLDGGLYDNLGLASVEDIRQFLSRRSEDLARMQRFPQHKNKQEESEQPIHYVIATDVDNIQPGLGFYEEASLAKHLGLNQAPQAPRPRNAGRWHLPTWIPPLITLAVPSLMAFCVGVAASRLEHSLAMLVVWAGAAIVVAVAFTIVVGPKLLAPLPRTWLQAIDLRQLLGLSAEFEPQSGAVDVWLTVSRLLRDMLANLRSKLLRSPGRSASLVNLVVASQERRLGQLLPAFNGYLKRTRSLTYGYLQKSYEPHGERLAASQRCQLIRNMIFELQPGPDVDPAEAAQLITLPVRDYRRRENLEPMQPIMRKLRHAAYARDLLLELAQREDAEDPDRDNKSPMNLVVTLMKPRKASLRDADLERSMKELNLDKAAYRWDWLTNSLEMGTRECPEDGPLAIDPTLRQLVTNVRQMLDAAREAACMIHPEQTEAMREHCAVNRGEDAKSYSWIPLICEMATNLSTTLWVKGFRWYEPNQLAEQRIIKTGRWSVQKPDQVPGGLPPLDLSITNQPAPALMITALAGYLSSCFNLLDFFYTNLGTSRPVRAQLVQLLESRKDAEWSKESLKQLADIPFALREASLREWRELHHLAPGDLLTGHFALLEPWLTCRDRYPEDC